MKQLNFQSELHFDFQIQKLVNMPLFVQSVFLPGLFTEAPQTGTQFSPIKHQGDTLFFQDLIVTMKLDEGMETWYEMFKWLTGLTRTESFQQFIDLMSDVNTTLDGSKKLFKAREVATGGKGYKNIKSIGSLMVRDSNHIPSLEIVFMNLHPTAMSGFSFRSDAADVGYIAYEVTFAYDFYFPKPVK